jgi:peptidoglycan/LPS O-acetylase OafA/YrhL
MTSTKAPRDPRHLPGLDLVRATAIAWVVLYHASIYWHVPGDSNVVRFGWMGVDLFFALSGFLIAGQLLRPWSRGTAPDYSRFILRRLLRTLPAYLVVLALYFLVPSLRDGTAIQPLWQFLTFTQNLALDPSPRKAFSHAWSLCVEEQFYLVFPLIVAVIAVRPSATKVLATTAAILIFGVAIRGYLWTHDVATTVDGTLVRDDRFMSLIYYPTWSRLDGLLAGVVAAMIQTFRPDWWRVLTARPNLLLLSGLTGIAASSVFFGDQIAGLLPTLFGYPLLAFSAATLVAGASVEESLIGRHAVPGVRALATGAYSLYLTHKMMFHVIEMSAHYWPHRLQHTQLVAGLVAASLAGTCLYWAVERPFLKLRERLSAAHSLRIQLIPQRR